MNPSVLFILYVLSSLFVAVFGRRRKWGFWGYFWASLLMSPLVGTLFVLASDPRPRRRPSATP
jgi:hypothetical protein